MCGNVFVDVIFFVLTADGNLRDGVTYQQMQVGFSGETQEPFIIGRVFDKIYFYVFFLLTRTVDSLLML